METQINMVDKNSDKSEACGLILVCIIPIPSETPLRDLALWLNIMMALFFVVVIKTSSDIHNLIHLEVVMTFFLGWSPNIKSDRIGLGLNMINTSAIELGARINKLSLPNAMSFIFVPIFIHYQIRFIVEINV